MKFFTKAALAVSLLFAAGTASATCLTGAGTCGDSNGTLVSIGGGAATVGTGAGNFLGETGEVTLNKDGFSNVDLALGGSGSTCTTPDCGVLTGSIKTAAGETLYADVFGASHSPDTPTAALNEISSAGLLTAQLPGQTYELAVGTAGRGLGQASFLGEEGGSETTAVGYSDFNMSLDFDGLCPTCENGQWNVNAAVGESVTAGASAFSGDSGIPAAVINKTEAVGEIELNFSAPSS